MEQHALEEEMPTAKAAAPPRRRHRRSIGGVVRLVFVFICIGLGIVFTLQNTAVVTVGFLVWSVTASSALLVFLLIVVGALIGWLLRSMRDNEGFRPLG